jgi:hypothetical protein
MTLFVLRSQVADPNVIRDCFGWHAKKDLALVFSYTFP